jgi:hypothetical protein
MLTKVVLALGVLAAALAIAGGGPSEDKQAALSYQETSRTNGGSAGGNFVPLW